jgi:hypothetical protein
MSCGLPECFLNELIASYISLPAFSENPRPLKWRRATDSIIIFTPAKVLLTATLTTFRKGIDIDL